MKRRWSTAVAVAVAVMVISASAVAADADSPIVVWLDETRVPAVDAWKAAHPEQPDLVTAEVVDILQIPAKIALALGAEMAGTGIWWHSNRWGPRGCRPC